ncbi:hypothetical protein GT037_005642 [Alternaria burnsii]|uniref:Uncharacterized protein n=1 Tax=Alternaria burnsii TaxID=1187904 RepID=A0A8H7B4C2_9PLEO|nr:uncharacterized protein GT037_005642 [Alternaria burnsii]KAF7676137.1 hypothetical protein GT037_005642 [Alternaria burnsii]
MSKLMFQDVMAEPYEHWGDHSSSSLGTHRPMEEISNESGYSEVESSGTEQSFCTAYATISPTAKKVPRKISRKSRFVEQFGSLKLTKANLHALEASHNCITAKLATPVEREIRFQSSPCGKAFFIPRKPLPESAREILQKIRAETIIQHDEPPISESDNSPCPPRLNAAFEDFLPYHQLRTWQQDDNEERQRQRARSLSAVAFESMKKFNSGCDNLSVQGKKTANQLKEVIKHRMLDHEK